MVIVMRCMETPVRQRRDALLPWSCPEREPPRMIIQSHDVRIDSASAAPVRT
jgi:hypothetical protein